MKWFFLLLLASAAGAILYYHEEIQNKITSATTTDSGDTPTEVVATGLDSDSGSSKDPVTPNPGPGMTKPNGNTKPPVKPVTPKGNEDDNDPLAKRYPMPKFKSIEQAVGNWTAIPASAFPREITVNQPVKIVLPGGVGSSTIKEGSSMFALDARSGMLTVGKTKSATALGKIAIDDTNYKQILSSEFNTWKNRQEQIVMKKRERYRSLLADTKVQESSTPSRNASGMLEYESELGKKPEQNSDGTVPLMLASLRKKDVDEIKPEIIRNWGPVVREVVDGEAYWTATVEYETVSMFGEIPTEAQALMRNGKVLKWIYTGSGESVP